MFDRMFDFVELGIPSNISPYQVPVSPAQSDNARADVSLHGGTQVVGLVDCDNRLKLLTEGPENCDGTKSGGLGHYQATPAGPDVQIVALLHTKCRWLKK